MANDPSQDGYKDWTDEQLAGLPGAPKRGANGGYVYSWRPEAYQDVLGEADISQQNALKDYRAQYGDAAVADDDAGAFQQMSGNKPLAGQGSSSVMNSWSGQSNQNSDLQNQLLQQMFQQQQQQMTENQARNTNLYNTLMNRAQQGTSINRMDPNIRQQADAYSANAERASRNYMADLAEKAGPYANLRGEQRLQAERLGQATGGFEAQLIGRELESRRAEIQAALQQAGSMLSADQQNALQRQLGILDNMIQQQGLGNDTLRTLLQNQQFYSNQNNQNDQFMAQLGFNAADRASYWDAQRRGTL